MAQVNRPAPNLIVEEWFQGEPSNIDRQSGKVILIEVFQVNCPGCFMTGLPEAIAIYEKFQIQPLVVWGLATAFEHFDRNNHENLRRLLATGEVIGDTYSALSSQNLLLGTQLTYRIPFPVAMDKLVPMEGTIEESAKKIIYRDFPQFDGMPLLKQEAISAQVKAYLKQKPYEAKTFDTYELMGTPSAILIDKKGILRHKIFGSGQGLEGLVEELIDE